ncbi:MAG TPA: bifunctional metallophosphatase/5'-nucleotidase [Miltoncostaea sp.]|nr:bifunctional metallophosphatase/5'-nucleotidase [Miltoncostaea sp.]
MGAGALALATAVAGLAAAGGAAAAPKAPKPGPTVPLQLLSFNDYHGHLQPPTGSDGNLLQADGTTIPAGGAEYLTTHLKQLREGHPNTLTVAAGDLIGGSPFLSGLFKDEPSVETLNQLGLDVSSVGNHEFDEGVTELLRMRYGGCHPVEGCFDADGYSGTAFPYLAANVTYTKGVTAPKPAGAKGYGSWFKAPTGRTILPPTAIKTVQGIKVGFIGMTLEGTPELVAQAGIRDVDFHDEVETANRAADFLGKRGVKAIVVLLHEGGLPPTGAPYDYSCTDGTTGLSGPIVKIAQGMSPKIDMLVTGHTHQPYTCVIPDPAGKPRWVTSASSFGRVITDTELTLSRRTKDVVRTSVTSVNRAVTRDVTPDPAQTATIAKWNGLSAPIANRPVGSITAAITRSVTRDTESPLGDLIADAQLAATSAADAGGAKMAFMNPGGVRADLTFPSSTAGEGDGVVTYGESFTVQPFGNLLVSMTLTGARIEQMLEQQWTTQTDGSVRFLHLGVSKGFTYSWSASAPVGQKVDPASIELDGVTIDPAASYRVTVNSFLADGGDGFTVLRDGTDRVGGGVDLDAFNAYLTANSPVTAPTPDRATRLP